MALYEQLTSRHFEAAVDSSSMRQFWALAKELNGILSGCHLEIEVSTYRGFVEVFEAKGMTSLCAETWNDRGATVNVWTKDGDIVGMTLYFERLHLLCFQWLKPYASDFSNGFFERAGNVQTLNNPFFAMPQLVSGQIKQDCMPLSYTERLHRFLGRLFEDGITVTDETTCRLLEPVAGDIEDCILVTSRLDATGSKDSPISISTRSLETLSLFGGIARMRLSQRHHIVSRYDKDLLDKLIQKKQEEANGDVFA